MSPAPLVDPIVNTEPARSAITWSAIIGGIVAALACHVALSELSLGCGLALYEPFNADSPDASTVAWTSIIAAVVTTAASLFLGGWVAGRVTTASTWMVSGLHGLLVWASASVLVTALLATALGSLVGGAAKAVGGGVAQVAGQAAQAIPQAVGAVAPNWDSIRSEIEQGAQSFRSDPERPLANPAGRGRLMEILGNAFSVDNGGALSDSDRQEAVGLLAAQLGLSTDEAGRALDQWQRAWRTTVDRFNTAKEEAAARARQTALAAKRYTAAIAMGGFATMLIGAISGFLGAVYGHACRHPRHQRVTHANLGTGTMPTNAHA